MITTGFMGTMSAGGHGIVNTLTSITTIIIITSRIVTGLSGAYGTEQSDRFCFTSGPKAALVLWKALPKILARVRHVMAVNVPQNLTPAANRS